ncbi:EscR/YscR/HrcR family type III secretion system export apparatus protein, partial [Myxococcota bacterium]|nr:EscR/YscR/HrcR family type III secretion system export apparatus protein [Myxococcota bacterium]
QTFFQLSKELNKGQKTREFSMESFHVLIPAFLMSEIKEAFIIGFLLFLPFLILDLLAANILMALGMHMLSPTTVSLPFKLLLFVSVDGFSLVAHALIKSYTVT